MLTKSRHAVGIVLVYIGWLLTETSSFFIRSGAWLMDQEAIIAEYTRKHPL